MTDGDRRAVLAAQPRIIGAIKGLPIAARFIALQAVLMQEVCSLPHGEREDAFRDIRDGLWAVFTATESGMQEALRDNARRGE